MLSPKQVFLPVSFCVTKSPSLQNGPAVEYCQASFSFSVYWSNMHRFLPFVATTLLLCISGDAELIRMNASHAHTTVCGWRAKATLQQIVEAGKYSKLKPPELDKLLVTYTNTTAMERLRQGYVGETRHTAAGSFFHSGAMEAAAAVLRLCTEEGGLVPSYRSRGSWAVPGVRTLPECGSKKLHLVVVTGEHIKPGATATERMWGRCVG